MPVTRRGTLVGTLAGGVLLGVGFPLVELWVECRQPTSEPCVWDRALLGVSLTIGALLGLIAGTVAYFVVRSWRRPPGP